jgi:hypothetical protein
MMKPAIAVKLGEQLGEFLKSDTRFSGYLRIHVKYQLGKPLMPSLAVKFKGRGQMMITLRYKNMPHFCFSCGRLVHATVNCDNTMETQGVTFGEELRASPPRRTKEILVKPVATRVVRSLFQVDNMSFRGQLQANHSRGGGTPSETKPQPKAQMDGTAGVATEKASSSVRFVNIVKEVHDACNSAEASWAAQGSAGREHVSFGTNMSTEDESSDGGSVEQKTIGPITAIERFQARKFGGKEDVSTGKRVVLKIMDAGSSKKQRAHVKSHMKEALCALVKTEDSKRTTRMVEDTSMEKQEMDTAMEANPLMVAPTHLTRAHVEPCQEQ